MVSEVHGPPLSLVPGLEHGGPKVAVTAPEAAQPVEARAKRGVEVVTLTDLAATLQELSRSIADTPVVDKHKVETFKRAVAGGTYLVDPPAIASRLVASAVGPPGANVP